MKNIKVLGLTVIVLNLRFSPLSRLYICKYIFLL